MPGGITSEFVERYNRAADQRAEVMMRNLDCVGVTGDVGKSCEEVIPAASACYAGSRFTRINEQITTGCISPEARDLLDTIMEEWQEQVEQSKQVLPADKIDTGDHYRFAYWLVRWSGLVRPA